VAQKHPIRVVAVDDDRLMRTMIQRMLEAEGDIEIVGLAENARHARSMIREQDPDVVTLDVEMPGMNGLAFLEKIMTLRPVPVIMVSSLTERGRDTTLEALAIGAVDAVSKPSGPGDFAAWGEQLRSLVRNAARARVLPRQRATAQAPPPASRAVSGRADLLVAIGASTGGVAALGELIQKLPRNCPPIVITQHMPVGYTERFARRLAQQLGLDCAEARDGEPLSSGMIRIAPGNRHLEIAARAADWITRLGDSAPMSGHCPSVDRLFLSIARSRPERTLGIIMTGMGKDGARGLLAMRQAGAACLAQSRESCVVYGMPKVAREMGAVEAELPITGLAQRIAKFGGRSETAGRPPGQTNDITRKIPHA